MQAPLTCCGGQSLSDLGCKNNPAKQLDAGGSIQLFHMTRNPADLP